MCVCVYSYKVFMKRHFVILRYSVGYPPTGLEGDM